MRPLKIRISTVTPAVAYSEAFKKFVVREYEKGALNKDQIRVQYGILGKSRLLDWCRKYGKFDYSQKKVTGRPMKDLQKQRIKEL